MGKRYSYEEKLKIEYLKCKIKELNYLKYEVKIIKEEIDEITYSINKSNTSIIYISNDQTNTNSQNEKWNKLIDKKDKLLQKLDFFNKEIRCINNILDSLAPITRDMTIDLFIEKYTSEKVKDKYFVSNPYQAINDELRYLDIDKF